MNLLFGMLTEKELEVLTRRLHGESQHAVAKALRISQAAVSKFETNARRKILEAEETLALAKRLGLAVEEGLGGKRLVRGGRR